MVQDFKETVKLTSLSSGGVNFLEGRKIESEPAKREFLLSRGGKGSTSSMVKGF